jgi:hypothetical protein
MTREAQAIDTSSEFLVALRQVHKMQASLRVTGTAATLQLHRALIARKSGGETRMKISSVAIGLSLVVLTAIPASAIESSIKGTSAASADAVWTKIGDFCGISKWHPAIEKCVLSADGKMRTLSLKGGGTVVEKLEKRDDAGHSYSYSIIDGPLPVANYMSTISVAKDGAGSVVTWSGKYDAKGASDADSKKTMDGVYQAGVDVLVK